MPVLGIENLPYIQKVIDKKTISDMIMTANVQPERKKQAEIDIGLSSILDSQDFQQEMCNYAKAGSLFHLIFFCEIQTIQRFRFCGRRNGLRNQHVHSH